jgi:D-alanyl-D-alanine endopeptidase (penicillin-binding protein 7)
MNRNWIAIVAAFSLALGAGSAPAQATTSKKKPVATKKHKVAKAHHHAPRHHSASLEDAKGLLVQSTSALVQDQISGAAIYEKNSNTVVPIASISKLMTAMVALDAKPSLTEVLTISEEDVDSL